MKPAGIVGRLIPFLVADVANSQAATSLLLLKRGWTVNRVRKTMMVLATCFSPLAIVAVFSSSISGR
jgi:hypothetical protein